MYLHWYIYWENMDVSLWKLMGDFSLYGITVPGKLTFSEVMNTL
jgi:hypothetical protein